MAREEMGVKGKTMVVGMKTMDGASMELLTWALVKMAAPGDLVIALHVLPYSSSDSCSSLLCTIKTFESMLAAYEGFCNLKQIDLKLKICRGSSLRRILVREVRTFAASKLVLGATKNPGLLGSWSSVAKRCARRLPRACSVMAVKNGRILFRRESPPIDGDYSPRSDSSSESWPSLSSLGRSYRISSREDSMSSSETFVEDDEIYPKKLKILPAELESLVSRCSSTCRLFSYQELLDATSSFSPEMLIGKGGSSRVYRGVLPGGREMAVKLLNRYDHVIQDFTTEIEILTAVHDKNIVSLLGLCLENENYAMIYDYYRRGSLEESLHDDASTLGWTARFDIAIGVAEALDYLHGESGTARSVIHGDVKSSNVLITDDLQPRLSDFGLARRNSSDTSHQSGNDIAGTFGYLAPEYLISGKLNEEVDVYAFGVVLLELLTGKKPIDTENPGGHESLVMWAKPLMRRGEATKILDPRLGGNYNADQAERMALAADLCIKKAPKSRPRMSFILKLLRGEKGAIERGRAIQAEAEEDAAGMDDGEEGVDSAKNFRSHLSLALLDVEDDCFSVSSSDHTSDFILSHGSLDDYLRGRWSVHSSFG
ncbi:protein kinase STUNTED-like isoform X2 [Wolffia australiana]